MFVSWSRSDPRVSKETLKGKVLPSSSSNYCLFQSTKPEATESTRLLIGFSDVLGLEITEDSIVLDIRPLSKMDRKVTCELGTHSATQSSITEVDVNQKSSGKWTEQCIVASDKPPYWITVGLIRQRELKFRQLKELLLKIPPLKQAADGGLQATYPPYSHVHGNPEERYLVLKEPTPVIAGQLACLDLLTTLPAQDKTNYPVKMYSLIECIKFNILLSTLKV